MLRRAVHAVTVLGVLLSWAACQGPPPVGRAANPPPPPPSSTADAEAQALLAKVDQLREQLKNQPKSHELRTSLGKLYYTNERFVDAAVMLREALDEQPDDVETLKLLGNCLFFLGNADDAVTMHTRALALAPRDVDALFFLGAILVESRPQDRDALKRAVECWTQFVELAPTHPRRKEIEEQLELVKKAQRGEITLGKEEQGAAQKQARPTGNDAAPAAAAPGGPGNFKKGTRVPALKADAKPLDRKRAEALDALDEGRFYDARIAAEAVLASLPSDDEMSVARARCMVQLGESEAAIKAFGEVIKRNPRYSPAWHYLGMAHMLAGDGKKAAQAWRDLISMDPEYAARNRLEQRAAMAENMGRAP
jgi:cytochrome c-type biogenesis protein CcmH/NrfG